MNFHDQRRIDSGVHRVYEGGFSNVRLQCLNNLRKFYRTIRFRMGKVSPRVFSFPFAIDRWITFRTSVWGFLLRNKFFSRLFGGLHFISLKNRSYVIICIFIFFIFNFNSWYTSKWLFYNVNISTFLCRYFEIVDKWGHSSNRKDNRCWCFVSSGSQICLWTFIMTFAWCLWSSTRHLSLQRHVYPSCFNYLFIFNYWRHLLFFLPAHK